MALIAILLCLTIQRWFHCDIYTRRYYWFESYYQWLRLHSSQTSIWWNGFSGVVIVILPLLATYVLISIFIYHTLTIIGYYFLTVIVLWYCMDARPFVHVKEGAIAKKMFIHVYQYLFALIFWLFILGTTGVVFYVLVINFRTFLEKSQIKNDETEITLFQAVSTIQGILDWLPLRLTGITFALVGHFLPTFMLWRSNVLTGIDKTFELVVVCGLTALDMNREKHTLSLEELKILDGLIDRALWVSIVVIALFTIGQRII